MVDGHFHSTLQKKRKTMRRFIVSKLYPSSSRPAASSLYHGHHHSRNFDHVNSGSPPTISNTAALSKNNGGITSWLVTMQKGRCFMSTQAYQRNTVTSYDESNVESTEAREAVKIKVISKEHIKPMSPTPQNLRHFKFSFFDQMETSTYHPFMFFYRNQKKDNRDVEELITERSVHLKQSLSETLTQFYPLAGKVASELHVDCNDEGVYYVETRVDDTLENVLKKPDNKFLIRLIPVVESVPHQPVLGSYVSMVQVNYFNCGSFSVTMQHNHKLVDASSAMTFLNAWAGIARKDPNPVKPSFLPPSMFSQNSNLPFAPYLPIWYSSISPAFLKYGKSATKRFVFDALALKKLKARASKHDQPVTRVLAVLALLWKCVTVETQSKPSILHTPVNIRKRSSPPLPETLVGNTVLCVWAGFDPQTSDLDLASMAAQLKKAITDVNSESIEELKGENGHIKFVESHRNSMEILTDFKKEYYVTSSICNSGTKEADFGWGKPVWACTGNLNEDIPLFMNRMIVMDSCSGGGIEVWVTLEKHVMDAIKCNPELLSYASVNPSPLELQS